ncbi:MAG: translocation/assembly module TamB domain-containing protein [Steroidobacteraceae bacterium]
MRRPFKIAGVALCGLLLLIVAAGGALIITGNTGPGRALMERMTSRLTGGHVQLTGLGGSFPAQLTLEKLQLSDDRGVWLTAEKVSLRWTPTALLHRLQIDSVRAATVFMERLPESSSGAKNAGLPSIPRIDAASVSIDELKLGPQMGIIPAPLVVRGAAHLRSLTDMFIDAEAHGVGGSGDYALHLHFDPQRMDAMLKLNEPAGGPLENLLQLPGLGALAATLNLSGPRLAERLDLSVDAGALHGGAHGNVNVDEQSADLEFAFRSAAMSPRPELTWNGAVLNGRWHGSLGAPDADGHFDVDQLQLPGGTQLSTLSADVTARPSTVALKAVVGGLRLPVQQALMLKDSPLTLDAVIHLNEPGRPVDISAAHRLFTLQARAETLAALKTGRRDLSAELRLPDLGPWAALAGMKVRGTALLKAKLESGDAGVHGVLDASAALAGAPESWSAAVGLRPTLQLSGALADSAITIESMKFSGRAVSLTASGGALRPASAGGNQGAWILTLPWNLSITDLSALSHTLAGTLKASGVLQGPSSGMVGTAQLTAAVSIGGAPTGLLSATARLRGLPSAPAGTLLAHGALDEAPLDVDVELTRSPAGVTRAVIRRAEWKSAHVDGDFTVGSGIAQTRGRLRVDMERLQDLRHLLGSDIAGSLAGTVELKPEGGRTRGHLKFEARDLKVGPFAGSAEATGDGFTDALALKVGMRIPDLSGTPASLSAAGTLDLDSPAVIVSRAVLSYRKQDVRLLSPARITFADGVAVDALKLGAQQARLTLNGRISPALDLQATLRQVDPPLINAFFPEVLAAGTIEASARLQGTVAAPTGQVRVTAVGMRMANEAALGLPAADLEATAELMGDTADIDARLSAGSASQVNVEGRAALTIDGAQDLKIKGNLDVGLLNPLLESSGQHTSGKFKVDATVAGSMAVPQIVGTMSLANGTFSDYGRGVSVSDITAEIVGAEGQLRIKSFTASAAPGSLSMKGTVGVLQPGLPVDLEVTAKNAQPIASKMVTSNFNADVHITGTARDRLDIAGSVNLNRTVIGIVGALPPNVAVLDVRRHGRAPPAPQPKRLVIGLDVTLEAPREILVQGRGLDAELGGELHITGTTDAPQVSGGFDLERGYFSLASSRLNFTAGRVSFDGAGLHNTIDPTLDFTANTTAADTIVSLRITGHADAPQFEFTSTPVPLPPDEIMARLLFGVNAAQLSALQLAQIGAALASLSGVGGDGGLNPLVKLQKSLGLDRLTVGAATGTSANGTANSGASIEAGRYISRRIYIAARQNTTGGSQLETDVELTKHLKLQTRLGNGIASAQGTTPENDPGSSVGLSYQFEY